MREDEVVRVLVRPVAEALSELHRVRIPHGGINPTNLYVTGREGGNPAALTTTLQTSWERTQERINRLGTPGVRPTATVQ